MLLNVSPIGQRPGARNTAYLYKQEWNDWWTFENCYELVAYDDVGNRHDCGSVKIAYFGMVSGTPVLSKEFDVLPDNYFSLGQGESYYEMLYRLGDDLRERILVGLRDCARNLELFDSALNESSMQQSLLRSVSAENVRGRYHNLALGDATLTPYDFRVNLRGDKSPALSFSVKPGSQPPTNIHVLIGRNGVGKTTTLGEITTTFVQGKASSGSAGTFSLDQGHTSWAFSSLVSVAFSAFDPFVPVVQVERDKKTIPYRYVGLKKTRSTADQSDGDEDDVPVKSPNDLLRDFLESAGKARQGLRRERWKQALTTLETDPLFKEARILDVCSAEGKLTNAGRLFKNLSSGHKIVLLTITSLVELVDDRSLVLLDEPEAHLHPPLLSAFIRALSDLLITRNGVAIVATHSPVVLQEVPSSCVWLLYRTGTTVTAARPDVQTFGENLGGLTREVFGLEVIRSGFHRMLTEAVNEGLSYDEIVTRFGSQLGDEARAILRALIAMRDSRNNLPDRH